MDINKEHKDIKTIIIGMTKHPNNVHVQNCGCMALGDLAINDSENRITANKCKGVETIVTIMTYYAEYVNIQEYGCGTLGALATDSSTNKIAINECNGIEAIITAMRRHVMIRSLDVGY